MRPRRRAHEPASGLPDTVAELYPAAGRTESRQRPYRHGSAREVAILNRRPREEEVPVPIGLLLSRQVVQHRVGGPVRLTARRQNLEHRIRGHVRAARTIHPLQQSLLKRRPPEFRVLCGHSEHCRIHRKSVLTRGRQRHCRNILRMARTASAFLEETARGAADQRQALRHGHRRRILRLGRGHHHHTTRRSSFFRFPSPASTAGWLYFRAPIDRRIALDRLQLRIGPMCQQEFHRLDTSRGSVAMARISGVVPATS